VRRRFQQRILVATLVAVVQSCLFATMTIADEVYRVYGVNVYFGSPPECPMKDFSREVRTTVAPFEQAAPIGEIIGELARLAAEQGANTLHSIRILSAAPYRGADVAAVAVRCAGTFPPQPDGLPALDNVLLSAVKAAMSAVAYAFPDAGTVGPDRSVDQARLNVSRELDRTAVERLHSLILSPDSFDLTKGLAKSCPFIPNIGFRFGTADAEVWWLVSFDCETGMLARRNDRWQRIPPLNLKPDALKAFRQLAQ
jgi:hypothetical protein